MPGDVDREILTWDAYGRGARELASLVADDGYRPDLILAIARGGLFVAGSLGYALDVKNILQINVEYYTGVDQRLTVPIALPPVPELVDLGDATVLIADDVADTGDTLAFVHAYCAGKVGEVRTAVLYEKPRSAIQCEYVWQRTDRWIVFPWSAQPRVTAATEARQHEVPVAD